MNDENTLWTYQLNPFHLPGMQGRIALGTCGLVVPVTINCYYREAPETYAPEFCKRHSFIVCRLACMLVDAIRGRGVTEMMRRHLSQECIERIEFMWELMRSYECTSQSRIVDDHIKRFPTVPRWMEVSLVSNDRIEYNVNVDVGKSVFHSTLVFRKRASKWVAVHADVG